MSCWFCMSRGGKEHAVLPVVLVRHSDFVPFPSYGSVLSKRIDVRSIKTFFHSVWGNMNTVRAKGKALNRCKECFQCAHTLTHTHTHELVNACTLTHNKRPRVNVYRSHCAHGERKWTQWSGQLDVTDLPTITAGVGQDRDSQSCLTQTAAMSLHPPGSFTFIPPFSEVPDV